MKVVVEALGLTAGGGKTGTFELLVTLARQHGHEFVFLLPDLTEYASISGPHTKVIFFQKSKTLLSRYLDLNRTVPSICAEERANVLLCLGNFAPHRPPVPTVLFMQNSHYVYREPVAYRRATLREKLIVGYGRHYFRRLSGRIWVVVQTEVMKKRLVKSYHIHPCRVVVIADRDGLPPKWEEQSKVRMPDPSRPFTFLCLGRYYAHKNLEILVDALKCLPTYASQPVKCIITISANHHPGARKLLGRIERENLERVLVNCGAVPIARLAEVYRSADAFILPTLLESFGRIYLEAMHFGLPILTSDRDFAHDRCQDAALYFDPLDADSVARSMARIMEDEQLRLRLAENGKRILERMPTWDEIAAQFVAALEQVVERRPVHSGPCLKVAAPR